MPRKVRDLISDLRQAGFLDRGVAIVTDAARYVKLVEWSEEDGAFVGQCPGIIGPCCHGAAEVEVYRELCQIVEEWVEITHREGRPLPPATAGTGIARQIV